jgi:hypothetical protein
LGFGIRRFCGHIFHKTTESLTFKEHIAREIKRMVSAI